MCLHRVCAVFMVSALLDYELDSLRLMSVAETIRRVCILAKSAYLLIVSFRPFACISLSTRCTDLRIIIQGVS
jgi:hypothetical protein